MGVGMHVVLSKLFKIQLLHNVHLFVVLKLAATPNRIIFAQTQRGPPAGDKQINKSTLIAPLCPAVDKRN